MPGIPDAVTSKVAEALESAGYKNVRIQHDTTLTPARTVIGYSNSYNNGTAEDGFGIQFQAGSDFAAAIIYGHWVTGDPPKLGAPLNPSPSAGSYLRPSNALWTGRRAHRESDVVEGTRPSRGRAAIPIR